MITHVPGPRERGRLAAILLVQLLLATSWLGTPGAATAHDIGVRHLDGTWERLAAPPNGSGLEVTDALALPDGEIVILNTIRRSTNSGACVARFSPEDDEWHEQPTTGSGPGGACFMDDEQFVAAPDGRLYSTATVVDPTNEPWEVEPGRLWDVADSDGELPLAIDTDGLLYVTALRREADRSVTRFVTVDAITEATGTTDALQRWNWWPIAGPSESIYAVHLSGVVARYDPAEDVWHDEAPPAPADLDRTSAALGPDGRIYVLGSEVSPFPGLWAWDGDLDEWLPVPIPDDLNGDFWKPQFVAGEDGALYAMDIGQPYRFVPGAVADPSEPGSGGFGGTTGPTETPTPSPSESPSPAATASSTSSPTPTPTLTEEPSPTASPSASPSASLDAAAAGAALDGGGPIVVVLFLLAVVAFLAIAGVFGWRWHQQRRAAAVAAPTRGPTGPTTDPGVADPAQGRQVDARTDPE